MPIIQRILGALTALIGISLLAGAVESLAAMPAALQRVGREPEDFYGLLFLAAVAALFSAATLAVGWILVRRRPLARFSPEAAAGVSIAIAAVFIAVAGVGYLSNKSSAVELRFLPIPALVLLVSAYLLRRVPLS